MRKARQTMCVSEVVKAFQVGPFRIPRKLGDDLRFRIEIVQIVGVDNAFDAVVWRLESYKLTATFPRAGRPDRPQERQILVNDTVLGADLRAGSVAEVCEKLRVRFEEKFTCSIQLPG